MRRRCGLVPAAAVALSIAAGAAMGTPRPVGRVRGRLRRIHAECRPPAITSETPNTLLEPNATGEVILKVHNPNDYSVHLVSVVANGAIHRVGGVRVHRGELRGEFHQSDRPLRPDLLLDHLIGAPHWRRLDVVVVTERVPRSDVQHPRHHHGPGPMRVTQPPEQATPPRTASRRARLVVTLLGMAIGVGILGAVARRSVLAHHRRFQPRPPIAASLSPGSIRPADRGGQRQRSHHRRLEPADQPAVRAQYQLARTSGPGSPTTVCTVGSSVTSCQDTGLTATTTYGYSITAVLDNWQSSAITTSATTATPTFTIALSAGPRHGPATPITVQTITAKIGSSTDTTYTGAKTVTWSGLSNSPSGHAPSYPSTAVTFTNGVASPGSTFTAYAAGSNTLTATDANATSVTGNANFTAAAGAASAYSVANPGK